MSERISGRPLPTAIKFIREILVTSKLSDSKISSWILTIDILGNVQRMSESDWLESLSEILNASRIAVEEAMTSCKGNTPTICQYGGSLSICHDDPDFLVIIAIETMKKYIEVGILAQMGISRGDAYYLENSTLHLLMQGHKKHPPSAVSWARSGKISSDHEGAEGTPYRDR